MGLRLLPHTHTPGKAHKSYTSLPHVTIRILLITTHTTCKTHRFCTSLILHLAVLILLFMSQIIHLTVLILLYLCPHTIICVPSTTSASAATLAFRCHCTITMYVSSISSVLIRVHIERSHTTLYVSSDYYISRGLILLPYVCSYY